MSLMQLQRKSRSLQKKAVILIHLTMRFFLLDNFTMNANKRSIFFLKILKYSHYIVLYIGVRPIPCWRPIPDTIGRSCTDTDTENDVTHSLGHTYIAYVAHTVRIKT